MGKKQSFIPWYLLSSKLIEVGCNSCVYLKQARTQSHTQAWETVSCETLQTLGRVVQTILVKSKLVDFQLSDYKMFISSNRNILERDLLMH